MAGRALEWERDGRTWPNREHSRFLEAGGLAWHVQVAGRGPVLLLLHGTGASTHSWRDLLPRLLARFTVVAPDLPGHAFTSPLPAARMTLPGMAAALTALLTRLGCAPAIAVGHSAGAAIAVWMATEHQMDPAGLVAFNGALRPIGGVAGQVFSPLARLLARSTVAAGLFARWADDRATVARLLAQTGSRLDPSGIALYHRLAASPDHTGAALAMMAGWDLTPLQRRLSQLRVPLLLIVGSGDRSVPPADAEAVRRLVPTTIVEPLRGLGHLAHEEHPAEAARLLVDYAERWNVLLPAPAEPATF